MIREILTIMNYVDGVADTPFHDASNPIIITEYSFTSARMGSVTLTATLMYPECLDNEWNGTQYVEFRGEKYFVNGTPSSSKDNEDTRYRHDITFMSERDIKLNNIYFYDAVSDESSEDDKYRSNSTKVVFFGTVNEFADRLSQSLKYSGVDYTVVVDEGITSEAKLMSFENQFFFNVLQEIYNVYNLPFYFEGKTIHIGHTSNVVSHWFRYGAEDGLLSIKKNNANTRIVTRCSGTGSGDNIPYYYPNSSPKGDVTAEAGESNIGILQEDITVQDSVKFTENMAAGDSIEYSNADITIEEMTVEDSKVNILGLSFLKTRDELSSSYKDVEIIFSTPGSSGDAMGVISFKVLYSTMSAYLVGVPYKFGADFKYMILWHCEDEERNVWKVVKTLYDEGRLTPYYSSVNLNAEPIVYDAEYRLKLSLPLPEAGKYKLGFQAYGYLSGASEGSSCMVSIYPEAEQGTWILQSTGETVEPDDLGLKIFGQPAGGDTITQKLGSYINTSPVLLPSIYRETEGAERFYNAISDKYPVPDNPAARYMFENEYVTTAPKEHIQDFPDIKPTITGMVNSAGQRIDTVLAVAFDGDDNDEVDKENNYKHPYFFVKLPKFDGTYGFNLFGQASADSEMTLSFTSGQCGACEFPIGVSDDERQANLVQVDSSGNLLRDEQGNVRCGRKGMPEESPQERQNDTVNNEVWIALKKEESTYGQIMPNVAQNLRVNAGDTFVILHIMMPEAYILNAEKRLKEAVIQYMAENNSEKFNFSIEFSRIYLAEHPDIADQINENARFVVVYNDEHPVLYVSQFTYKCVDDEALPEISVELSENITVNKTTLQNTADAIMQDVNSMFAGSDFILQGIRYFLRKDVEDSAMGKIIFRNGIEVGDYQDGNMGAGGRFGLDADGSSHLVTDYLEVRKLARFNTLEVQETKHAGGETVYTPAGMICSRVEMTDNAYRCYFNTTDTSGREIYNEFRIGDQAFCRSFNDWTSKYYWRLVTGVGYDYIDLSIDDCDEGSMMPEEGDSIVQLGNRDDPDRQSAQVFSTYGEGAPSYIVYNGINSYSLADKNILGVVYNQNTKEPQFYVFGSFFVGDRNIDDPESTYMTFQQKEGESRKRLFISADMYIGKNSTGLTNLSEWSDKQQQINDAQDSANNAQATANEALEAAKDARDYIDNTLPDEIAEINNRLDGVVENWFYEYTPTRQNEPAATWISEGEEADHVGDTFTNIQQYVDDATTPDAGKSWRWALIGGQYNWTPIADSDAVKALQNAAKAQDTADQKRRVFVTTPYTPYDVGDMWTAGPTGDIMRCIKARATGNYTASDWDKASKYTDDTVAIAAQNAADDAKKAAQTAQNAANIANTAVTSLKNFTDTAFSDGIIDRAEAVSIEKYINTINETMGSVTAAHQALVNNTYLPTSNKNLLNSMYNNLRTYATALLNKIDDAIEDNKTNVTEKAAVDSAYNTFVTWLKNYNAQVEASYQAIQKYLKDYTDEKVSDYDYLTQTLGPGQNIDGVTMSKMVAVKDENQNVKAFLNGSDIGKDSEHGKLLIAGGVTDITNPQTSTTRIYEDGYIETISAKIKGRASIDNGNLNHFVTTYDEGIVLDYYKNTVNDKEDSYQLFLDKRRFQFYSDTRENSSNDDNNALIYISLGTDSHGRGQYVIDYDGIERQINNGQYELGEYIYVNVTGANTPPLDGTGILAALTIDAIMDEAQWSKTRMLGIKCLNGQFGGLRPYTRVVSSETAELTELDFCIIVSSSMVEALHLPTNPQRGQMYIVINARNKGLLVYPQTVRYIYSMPAGANETVNNLAAYETAIYNFSEQENKWYLTVIKNKAVIG